MRLGIGMGLGAGGGAPAFAETDITGVKLFLDADGLTVGALAAWNDSGPGGKHGVASGSPTCVASVAALGGQKAVLFSGSSGTLDYFTVPDLVCSTSVDIFAVLANAEDPPLAGGDTGMWIMGSDGTADTHPFTDSNIYDGAGSTTRHTVGNPAFNMTGGHIYGVRSAAGAFSAEINGSSVYSSGANAFGMVAAPKLGTSLSNLYYRGHIAKLIVVSPQMSAGNRTALLALWGAQYGITVA